MLAVRQGSLNRPRLMLRRLRRPQVLPMCLAARFVILAGLALPTLSLAQGLPPGTVTVASRTFLVGEAPSESMAMEDFLPLTEVQWFWDLVQDDPILDGAVIHIEMPPSPPAYHFGPEGVVRDYPDTDRVPDAFRTDGYLSATTDGVVPTQFLFRQDVPKFDFFVTCAIDPPLLPPDRFNLCVVRTSYPLDPAIMLKARLYFPPPFAELSGRFEAIADRLREIALCLDVTEAPPTDPKAALTALLAANPNLEDCEDKLSS